jgi:hypothetical protein
MEVKRLWVVICNLTTNRSIEILTRDGYGIVGMMYRDMPLLYIYRGYIDQSETCRDIKVILQVTVFGH